MTENSRFGTESAELDYETLQQLVARGRALRSKMICEALLRILSRLGALLSRAVRKPVERGDLDKAIV